MNCFKLGSCGKCRGDLTLDEGDWLCLQCGTYYYTGLYPGSWVGERPAPLIPRWASISDGLDSDSTLTLRLPSTRAIEV